MILSFTGFMGCGKSSVGRKLSSLLSCSYADLDRVIEEKEGCSVREIFETEGEAYFRKLEKETLEELIADRCRIISLGGGTLETAECREIIRQKTVCIYLKASPETLMVHMKHSYIRRPLLADIPNDDPQIWEKEMKARIGTMLSRREENYTSTARYTICIDGKNTDEIIRELALLMERED